MKFLIMRISILGFFTFCFLCHFSFGQGLSKAEYFFDSDPGFGNGTTLNLTGNPDSLNQNFSIPIGSLNQGFHNLFFRVRNTQGKWSMYMGRRFFVLSNPSNLLNGPIAKAEYFFDTDPGFGNGTPLNISPSSDSISQNIAIPISGLTVGFHNLFFRVKSNQGKWSMYMGRRFYVLPNLVAAPSKKIINAEYFFDADPGVGNGIDLPISQIGDSVNFSSVLNVGNLSLGSHVISVRVQDSSRVWSLYFSRPFNVCTNPPTTQVSPAGPINICSGQTQLLTALGGTGFTYQWQKDGVIISNATNASYTVNASGTYSAIVTNPSGCSTISNYVEVTISSPPSATVTSSGPLDICAGDSVSLQAATGAGYTYQWSIGNNNIPGATNSNLVVNSSGSYRVTISIGSGCSVSSSYSIVTTNAPPPLNIDTIGSATICIGSNVSLSGSGNGIQNYQWYQNGNPIVGATQNLLNISLAGSYLLEVSNSFGCITLSPAIEIFQSNNSSPSPLILVNDSTPCLNDSSSLQSSLSGNYLFTWLFNGSPINGASNEVFHALASGNYQVSIIDTTTGCSGISPSANITFLNNILPAITGAPNLSFCSGGSTHLKVSPNYLSYQWFFNGLPFGTNNDSLFIDSVGVYSVSVIDTLGCSLLSTPVNVSLFPSPIAPVISPPGPLEVCFGNNLTLSVAGSFSTIKWFRDGANAGSVASIVVGNNPGIYNFWVVVTNSNNCSATTDTTTVTIKPTPVISLAQVPTNLGLNWTPPLIGNPPGGVFSGPGVQGNQLNGYIFDPLLVGVGSFTINYSYTDTTTTCSASQNININVNPTGLNELKNDDEIKVFPNPSIDFVSLKSPIFISNLLIYDTQGREIKARYFSKANNEYTIDVSKFAQGLYTLLIFHGNEMTTKKFEVFR
jgi:hypothetical protein